MYKKYFKRILDIIISLIMIPFLVLLIIVVGFLIKLEDRGSIFYLGERLGQHGRTFRMYKFRSMKVNAEDIRNNDGTTFNSAEDPRLTKIGKILRQTSIDEIPQIINVLKGDMSFIGPRPDLPEHKLFYNDYEKRKLIMRPGLTGYNQAYFRNSIEWKRRLKNDVYYIENVSCWLDIKIIFKTVQSVIFGKGVFHMKKASGENDD